MKVKPIARKGELVIQESNDELLVYDLKIDKMYCLKETSASVWQLCNGENSITNISKQISCQYKQPVNEEFVWLALTALEKDDLLIRDQTLARSVEKINRREIIKKVGFASLVTLPVITSVVTPRAVNAQSLDPDSIACLPSAVCQGPNCIQYFCAGGPGCATECEANEVVKTFCCSGDLYAELQGPVGNQSYACRCV